MSTPGQHAANRGLEIIQEIINAVQQSHTPVAENTAIPQNLRQHLANRVTREVHAETDPLIAQLQAQMPALRQALHREVSSIKGANEMAANAISDVSTKGLHGLAKKQLAEELASRQADVLASTPFLAADARQQFQEQKTTLQTDIAKAQAEQASGIAKALASALGSARTEIHARAEKKGTDALATLKANTEKRADKGHAHQQLNLALAEAKRLLTAYAGQIPQTEAQWQKFAGEVAKAEGISNPGAVQAAIERIRKMLDRDNPFSQQVHADQAAASSFAPLMAAIQRGDFKGD